MQFRLISLMLLLSMSFSSYAQWSRNASLGYLTTTTDKVGIGTITPRGKFDVAGQSDIYLTNDPIAGGVQNVYLGGHIFLSPHGSGNVSFLQARRADNSGSMSLRLRTTNNEVLVDAVHFDSNGNVGIGSFTPETKLHIVGGTMSLDGAAPVIYTGSGSGELNRYLSISNSPATPTSAGLKTGGLLVSDSYTFANPSKNDLIVKGRVGIGTTLTSNPNDYSLNVNGKINATAIYVNDQPIGTGGSLWSEAGSNVFYEGAVGIGTTFATNPHNYSLFVNGKINATSLYVNDVPVVSSQWTTDGAAVKYNGPVVIGGAVTPIANNYSLLVNGKVNASELYINDQVVVSSQWVTNAAGVSYSGAVGIGTTLANNPNSYRFAVNGKVGAHDVRVEKTSTTWPDYVFNPDYRLPALSEVEAYIKVNRHLQDVPAAAEVEQNGHSLGDMDAVLLKKVEELTLYILQQEKRMDQQQMEIEALKAALKKN